MNSRVVSKILTTSVLGVALLCHGCSRVTKPSTAEVSRSIVELAPLFELNTANPELSDLRISRQNEGYNFSCFATAHPTNAAREIAGVRIAPVRFLRLEPSRSDANKVLIMTLTGPFEGVDVSVDVSASAALDHFLKTSPEGFYVKFMNDVRRAAILSNGSNSFICVNHWPLSDK